MSRLRWPFPPLPLGVLSADPLPSCSLFPCLAGETPLRKISLHFLCKGLPAALGLCRAWVLSLRHGDGGGQRPFWKPRLASVTLSFLRVQWVRGKMTFFSPVSKGQWEVTGGTVRTQVDVKQTQRFLQVLGGKRKSLEQVLSKRAPGSCRMLNNLAFPESG